MPPDTYAWYLSASSADRVPPPAPSAAEIVLAIVLAVGLVALFIVVLTWEPRPAHTAATLLRETSPLTRAERRALAEIEHVLEASDPELARFLAGAASGAHGR